MAADIVITERIRNTILGALKSGKIPEELAERLSPFARETLSQEEGNTRDGSGKETISFCLVKQLWEWLREHSDQHSKIYLHELISGSEIYFEHLKPVKKSPELVARLNKLRAEQEETEYNRMVSSVDKKWNQSSGFQLSHEGKQRPPAKTQPKKSKIQPIRSGSKQLASIANFVLSLVATFVFGYVASQYAFPSIAVRVIIGVLLAFIVAIAELYFMVRVEI